MKKKLNHITWVIAITATLFINCDLSQTWDSGQLNLKFGTNDLHFGQ